MVLTPLRLHGARRERKALLATANCAWSERGRSQRMLNAIEPGSPLSIHRHRKSSETVVCLRGRLVEEFYDELERRCTEAIELSPGGPVVALNSPSANGTPSAPWNPALS